MTARVRVELPYALSALAGVGREVTLAVEPATQRALLEALERALPPLRGTVRDPATGRRRPYLRFFACEEDLSHAAPDEPLPAKVVAGEEAFLVVGAIAGG